MLVVLTLSCGSGDSTKPTQDSLALVIIAQPVLARDAQVFPVHPAVEVRDREGRRIAGASQAITARLETGTGTLTGATTVTAVNGLGTFADLGYAGKGPIRLRFEATSLTAAVSDTIGIAAQLVLVDSTRMSHRADSLAEAAGTYTFLISTAAPVIDSGQVLVGVQGDGFLRRVERVRQAGKVLTIQTTDASLSDLGITGAFTDTIVVSAAAVSASRRSDGGGAHVTRAPATAGIPVTYRFRGLSMLANGLVNLTLTSLDYEFRPAFIPTLVFDGRGQLIQVGAEVTGALTVTGQYAVQTVGAFQSSQTVDLPSPLQFPLPPIILPTPFGFPIPIPNKLVVGLEVEFGFGASRAVTYSVGFQGTGTLGGRVSWTPPGGAGFTPTLDAAFSVTPVAINDLHADWQLKAATRVKVSWELFGVGGPFLSFGPYARFLAADNAPQQRLDLLCDWGLTSNAGVHLKIFRQDHSISVGLVDVGLGPFCNRNYPYGGLTTGSIAGTVMSSQGDGLAGVTVTTSPSNLATTTGVAGDYTITQVPPGPVVVGVSSVPAGCIAPSPQKTTVNAGGTATANFVVPCPPSVALTATPPTIDAGQSSTLKWTSAHTTSCNASWTSNTGTSGSQVVSPAATTTYTITCMGASGVATASATVTVSATPLLTVTGSGTGSGSVTSNVGGINCSITAGSASGSCSASFNSGTSVTLTATPASGDTFAGWSGACSGIGSCQVTMTQARSVTASFTAGGSIVFAQVAAGGGHTCGLTSTGVAYCWGDNGNFGQLGDGTRQTKLVPTPVSGGLTFVRITAGANHTCGLTSAGAAYCWGNNNYSGAIGDGTKQDRYVPTPVTGGLNFVELTAGYLYTCGRTSAGTAYCWGTNYYGELGDGTTQERLVPTPVGGGLTFIQLTAGTYHTCGRTSTGAAYCWGNNLSGELGVGEVLGLFDKRLLPTPVVGGISFVQLTASIYNTCGISSAGAAFCWGDNGRGQLGEGRTIPRSLVPMPVAGGLSFVALTAGGLGTCGLTNSGGAYCWGDNRAGQLGDGTTQDRSVPTPVAGALSFGQLTKGSAGFLDHTCGRTTAGTVYCWGYNGAGQLGDGTQQSRQVPTPVKSP